MPLKTLTRQEFLKRRPKGDYAKYKAYIAPFRTGRGPQLPMNPTDVNQIILQNLTSGYMNPAQMRREATRSVNDAISSALGDLRGTTAAAQKQATDQARAYEGFARAMAEARRSDAGYVTDLYRDAASDQARFASGITGAVGDAARSDAAAQQADVAAATGQAAGYHGPDPGAMQSVGYFLGGQIPSARLSENAAYLGENALRQGLASAERLGLEGAGMRQKAIDLQSELARERAKLIKGRPAAVREALKGLSDDQRANLATLANVAYLQNTQAKTTADLTGLYQGQPTINTYTDAKGVVRNYNPNTHRVKTSRNGSQFLEPLPQPPGSSSSVPRNAAGLTPSQQATASRAVNNKLQDGRSAMNRVLQDQKGPLWTQPNSLYQGLPGYEPKRKSYAEAKAYLMTQYANDLIKQYPEQAARIRQMVEETLTSAGFKKASVPKRKPPKALPRGGLASIVGGFVPKPPSR